MARPHDAGGVGREVDRGDGALVVREERDARRARADPAHRSDEPVGGDDRVVDPNAVVAADGDDDRLRVRCRRTRDHPGGETAEAVREPRAVPEVEQLSEPVVLAEGQLPLVDLLAQQLVLVAKALGVRARVEEAVHPGVDVAERLGDPVGSHLEGAQHGGRSRLRARHRAVVVLAEREGDEHEREENEPTDDKAPPHRGGGSRGRLACGRAPDGHAQHRRASGAVPWHRAIVPAPRDGPDLMPPPAA